MTADDDPFIDGWMRREFDAGRRPDYASHETTSRDPQQELTSMGETQTGAVDTSTPSVEPEDDEALIAKHGSDTSTAKLLEIANHIEHSEFVFSMFGNRVMAARLRSLAAERDGHSAYRRAASAFIASKGLTAEFDAWCERGHLPPDVVGRLLAVVRIVQRARRKWEAGEGDSTEDDASVFDALDSLPPELLADADHSA